MARQLLPWLCLGPLLAARAALVDVARAEPPPSARGRPEGAAAPPKPKGPPRSRPSWTHLLSFRSCSQDLEKPCNAHFFAQLRNLSDAARVVPGLRQHIYQGLPRELYKDPRWAEHVKDGVRGRGYWFWKPALVNLLLKQGTFHMNDVVVWCDADATNQVFKGNKRIVDLWSAFLKDFDQDIWVQPQHYCEATWTKGDVFQHFEVEWHDRHYGLTRQPKAQFWIVRLNERTVKFMRHWEDLVANFSLVSDHPSSAPNSPLFRQNRHDQTMYSMLLKANRLQTGHSPECDSYENYTKNLTNLTNQTEAFHAVGPGMLNGTASENANALEPANASVPEPVLHPRYGIKGLKVVMDGFQKQAARLLRRQDMKGAKAAKGPEKGAKVERRPRDRDAAKVGLAEEASAGPLREICVRGACYDLDALPPGALPSGVA